MASIETMFPPSLLLCALQLSCSSAVLAFTTASSPLRPAMLGLHVYLTYATIDIAYTPTIPFIFNIMILHFGVNQTLVFLARAIAEKWEYRLLQDQHGNPKPGRSNSPWDRFRTCALVLTASRGVNIGVAGVKEVKGVPLFARDGSVPTRGSLLLTNTLKAIAAYLTVDFFVNQPHPPNAADLFREDKIYFFRHFLPGHSLPAAEDVVFKLIFTALFWLQAYCIILVIYLVSANICMALGIYGPAGWRPQFGPLSALSTVRGAWGSFWHQQLRYILTANAEWIVHGLLRLPRNRGNLFVRYLKITVTFAISGVFHLVPVLVRPDQNPQKFILQFFLTQPLGIILEDAVQALAGPPKSSSERTARQVVGYIWTFLFFAWSTPVWGYPTALEPTPKPFLPISVFAYFQGDGAMGASSGAVP